MSIATETGYKEENAKHAVLDLQELKTMKLKALIDPAQKKRSVPLKTRKSFKNYKISATNIIKEAEKIQHQADTMKTELNSSIDSLTDLLLH